MHVRDSSDFIKKQKAFGKIKPNQCSHATYSKEFFPNNNAEEGVSAMILLFELNLLQHDKDYPIKPVIRPK